MNIETVLAGLQGLANGVKTLLPALAMLVGLLFIFSALRGVASKGSDTRSMQGRADQSWAGIGGQLLVGGLLLRFGATIEDVSVLLTGAGVQDYRGVMAYAPMPQGAGPWLQVIEVCLLWVHMLGYAGAFRGLLLWKKAADGGHSGGQGGDLFNQGLWHLIGGALCVNMAGAIQAFLGN